MKSRELFDRAIEVVLEHEGDTSTDHPADRGGLTKFGIAQRWNPDLDVRTLTRAQAIEIYWERYWQGRGYERLPEAIAIKVFDLAVNLGDRPASTDCGSRATGARRCLGVGGWSGRTDSATTPSGRRWLSGPSPPARRQLPERLLAPVGRPQARLEVGLFSRESPTRCQVGHGPQIACGMSVSSAVRPLEDVFEQ